MSPRPARPSICCRRSRSRTPSLTCLRSSRASATSARAAPTARRRRLPPPSTAPSSMRARPPRAPTALGRSAPPPTTSTPPARAASTSSCTTTSRLCSTRTTRSASTVCQSARKSGTDAGRTSMRPRARRRASRSSRHTPSPSAAGAPASVGSLGTTSCPPSSAGRSRTTGPSSTRTKTAFFPSERTRASRDSLTGIPSAALSTRATDRLATPFRPSSRSP
mmetsp:Transcript_31892/g.68573  ORF Transcript_31892/g.68573 Transcript_31892/m.68573 type:complete len:221 (+) Transcript_31892:1018-1680(+)